MTATVVAREQWAAVPALIRSDNWIPTVHIATDDGYAACDKHMRLDGSTAKAPTAVDFWDRCRRAACRSRFLAADAAAHDTESEV